MSVGPSNLVKVVCPECRQVLAQSGQDWNCPSCNIVYRHEKGVLSFLKEQDVFNVGESQDFQVGGWSHSAGLRKKIQENRFLSFANALRVRFSLSGRRDRIFLKEMAPHAAQKPTILDVGCGGGRHYFAEYGNVIGIDPILPLLLEARKLYSEVYLGTALRLPFADASFDYVVSTDVLGHILMPDKDALFSEMFRVLKPGGRTVHCAEVDSDNFWFRLGHKHPELFHEYFVDRPGHFGLEMTDKLHARFQKHGFKLVRSQPISGFTVEPGTVVALFDNEYRQYHRWLSPLIAIDRVLNANLLIRECFNVLLEPVAQLEGLFTGVNQAGPCVLVVFEKPS